jgi:hypothetical protein
LFVVPLLIGMNIYNRNLYEEFIKGRNSTPLTELFKTESPHGLKMLLNNNGTFDPNDSQKTLVTLEDKMTQIYNALFGFYTNRCYLPMTFYLYALLLNE